MGTVSESYRQILEATEQDLLRAAAEYPNTRNSFAITAHHLILADNLKGLHTYLNPKDELKADELIARVNQSWTTASLRPLHVAVIVGSSRAVDMLFNTRVCKPNKLDRGGATPLHHAAILGRQDLINLLLQHNAKTKITLNGAGHELIFKQCYPSRDLVGHQFSYILGSELKFGTAQDFKDLTGATWLSQECYVPATFWFKQWQANFNSTSENSFTSSIVNHHLKRLYVTYKSGPRSKTYLKFDPLLGYYLCAGETIPKFTIIGEYLGEVIDEECWNERRQQQEINTKKMIDEEAVDQKDEKKFCYDPGPQSKYFMGCKTSTSEHTLDASAYRGLMGMVNCSFPNVGVLALETGEPFKRLLYITLDEVAVDTAFAFDYGPHEVKRMVYRETREEAMLEFAKKNAANFHDYLFKKVSSQSDWQTIFERIACRTKAKYFLQTPTAMLTLVLNDLIFTEALEDLFFTINSPFSHNQTMESFFLEQLIQLSKLTLTEECKQELLDAIGKKKLLDIYRMLKHTYRVFEKIVTFKCTKK